MNKRNWNTDKGYKIYFNLHKKVFSILGWDADKKGWRLQFHSSNLVAEGIKFKVHETGRQRVLKEKRKNVHAFILADIVRPFSTYRDMYDSDIATDINSGIVFGNATYNPYKYDSFVDADSEENLSLCDKIILFTNKPLRTQMIYKKSEDGLIPTFKTKN